MFTVWW